MSIPRLEGCDEGVSQGLYLEATHLAYQEDVYQILHPGDFAAGVWSGESVDLLRQLLGQRIGRYPDRSDSRKLQEGRAYQIIHLTGQWIPSPYVQVKALEHAPVQQASDRKAKSVLRRTRRCLTRLAHLKLKPIAQMSRCCRCQEAGGVFEGRSKSGVDIFGCPGPGAEAHLKGISTLDDPEVGVHGHHSSEETVECNQLSEPVQRSVRLQARLTKPFFKGLPEGCGSNVSHMAVPAMVSALSMTFLARPPRDQAAASSSLCCTTPRRRASRTA